MFFRSCFMVAKRQSKLTTFLGYVFRSKKAVDPRSACNPGGCKILFCYLYRPTPPQGGKVIWSVVKKYATHTSSFILCTYIATYSTLGALEVGCHRTTEHQRFSISHDFVEIPSELLCVSSSRSIIIVGSPSDDKVIDCLRVGICTPTWASCQTLF